SWPIVMQVSLAVALLAAATAMKTSLYFQLTVAALFLIAILSATHDIACDGLYLMSLDKKRQASFSGVMATCSRLGRLTAASLVVLLAGRLINGHALDRQTAWAIALGAAAAAY